jgi:hypothetical protein
VLSVGLNSFVIILLNADILQISFKLFIEK